MSARAQLLFGMVFVSLGLAALFGELGAAEDNGRSANIGWIIGAAGFGLPGLLNVGLAIRRGGLTVDSGSDLSAGRQLVSYLGLLLALAGGIGMAVGLFHVLQTTGGDCGTYQSGRACPEESEKWFFLMGGSIPVLVIGMLVSGFASRGQ